MRTPDMIDLITDACDHFLRACGEPVEAIECAPDVKAALMKHAPMFSDGEPCTNMMINGVPLIVMPAFPPGCYRLVRRMSPPPIFDNDWWMTL